MGKGGMSSQGGALEPRDGEQENMAAWLVGVNTLKIQPFKLPTVGKILISVYDIKTLYMYDILSLVLSNCSQ